MKRLSLAAIAAALTIPAGVAAAAPAQCKLSTVNVPVTMDGLRPLVSAKISGEPVKLLLDSGAFFSILDLDMASKLKLKPVVGKHLGSAIPSALSATTGGAAGYYVENGAVTVPVFEFAGGTFNGVEFLTSGRVGGDLSGILGQNVLHAVDDEYDLKNGMLRLVRAEDCKSANMAYWAKPGTNYSVADLEDVSRYQTHTIATILINGLKMRAYFDTGAATSFITARAAARAGVKTTDPGVRPAGYSHTLDHDPIRTWVARFDSVKIGDEEIKNGQMSIGDSRATDFDVLIGADFFMAHHVYVANSQGKIYFTYEGGPVFRAAEAEEAAASQAKAD